MYITKKIEHPPPTKHSFEFFPLISESNYLEALLDSLMWFSKTSKVCGVGNKGANIMNYVDLSGIYQIWDLVYFFCEIIANPPGL